MQDFRSWLEYTVINLHAVMISSLLNMVVNLYFFFGSGLWLTHQQDLGTMGNVQRLPSLGQTNIYLRESKETLSRCFIMEYGASAHSTLPPPSSRVQVHRQRGLFVVVFWEEIHRKQDFMVAKSALNFLSLFLSLFLSKELLILDFLFIVHLYVLVGKLNYLIWKMVLSAEGRCTCICVWKHFTNPAYI